MEGTNAESNGARNEVGEGKERPQCHCHCLLATATPVVCLRAAGNLKTRGQQWHCCVLLGLQGWQFCPGDPVIPT